MPKFTIPSRNLHLNMSKRSASTSLPSTPRKRRNAGSKPPSDQHKLDSFFKPRLSVANASGSPVASTSRIHGDAITTASSAVDDDAALARRFAEEDGLDMDMLRNLESAFRSTTAAVQTRTSIGPKHEVIDVDLLDDTNQGQAVASSSTQSNKAGLEIVEHTSFAANSVSKSPIKPTPKVVGAQPAAESIEYPSLGVDPLSYPLDKSPWPVNASAPYSFLAHALSTLSGTRSRIVILNTLTNTLRSIIKYHPPSLCPALYLLSNALSPPYSPLELGLGPSIISRAIQDVSGLTPAALKRLYNTTGDPGM